MYCKQKQGNTDFIIMKYTMPVKGGLKPYFMCPDINYVKQIVLGVQNKKK